MSVFVTGVNGQLGYDVMRELSARGLVGVASGRAEDWPGIDGVSARYRSMDLTDPESIRRVLREERPEVVVHCAAWTNVDGAEDPENLAAVRSVNVDAARTIAQICRELDAKMVYISTDYVFNGEGTEPWEPDDTNYAPLNAYGQSKLDGELAVLLALEKAFIVRTAWVFGLNGKNFIRTMLRVGKAHDTVRVVNDQIGRPTYTRDLARLLVDLIGTERYGRYHATNEGDFISWYDFTAEIYRQAGLATRVIPVSTAEYGLSKARRPENSRLATHKLAENGFALLPEWKDALHRYLAETGEI